MKVYLLIVSSVERLANMLIKAITIPYNPTIWYENKMARTISSTGNTVDKVDIEKWRIESNTDVS